jgi:hypothetical protein
MSISRRFILVSIIYSIIGMTLGIGMGMHKDFSLAHLHAHINLIGWVMMAIFGLVYNAFPKMALSTIGKVHFYVANIGAILQLIGIYMVLTGGMELPIILGSMLTVISMLVFLVNFVKNGK